MVTKNAEHPAPVKQKTGRPSGHNRKFSLRDADPAKRERMEEYLRLRTLILGWSKGAQTCDIPELIEIAKNARELCREMEKREPIVVMIFKEDFKHIAEVASARLKNERGI